MTRPLVARAEEFDLDWTAAEDGPMVYEVVATRWTVAIKGRNRVAIWRCAHAYLRQTCNSVVT